MKTVFFDRDGVLNKELGRYVEHADEFEVNPWVIPFMKIMQRNDYQFIIITNQGGIDKGLYTHNDLFDIHNKLNGILVKENLYIKETYYCPHHPTKTQCLCRKPASLMVEKAVAKYGIDVAKSFLIGDKERDIEAAENVGVKGFLVPSDEYFNASQLVDLQNLIGFPVVL